MAVDHQNLPPTLSDSNFHAPAAADIPPRTSSSHGLLGSSNPSIPRRKSSKRPMSQNSGDWFAGKKPAMSSITGTNIATTAGAARPTSKENRMSTSPHTSPKQKHSRMSVHMSSPPPDPPPKDFGDQFIHHDHHAWSVEKEKILLGPFDYMYGQPGKDIRAQLIAAFNAWLKVPDSAISVITKVVGMLHTASLLVDDVEDSSLLRRGVPVAHSIFGTPQTLNSANYVYFLALQQLSRLSNPQCLSIYTTELLNLHRGQGMDLYWRDTLTCPSEADYLEMVSNKTAGLFRLAIKLMMAESALGHDRKVDCIPLVNTIGLYFQILDDLLNLSSPTYTARKGLCEDLTEGKFSFPVIHAIRAEHVAGAAQTSVVLNILRQKTTDDDVKKYAVGYMEKLGSFEYTRSVLRMLEEKAVHLIEGLEKEVGGDEGRAGGERIRAILGKLKAL